MPQQLSSHKSNALQLKFCSHLSSYLTTWFVAQEQQKQSSKDAKVLVASSTHRQQLHNNDFSLTPKETSTFWEATNSYSTKWFTLFLSLFPSKQPPSEKRNNLFPMRACAHTHIFLKYAKALISFLFFLSYTSLFSPQLHLFHKLNYCRS